MQRAGQPYLSARLPPQTHTCQSQETSTQQKAAEPQWSRQEAFKMSPASWLASWR